MGVISSAQSSNKWLLILLLIVVLLTIWTALQSDSNENFDTIELADRGTSVNFRKSIVSNVITQPSQMPEAQDNLIPWAKLKREPLRGKTYNLFKIHSWAVVTPAKKVKPAPPRPPEAPQAPFTYMGKLEDDSKSTQIFLMANGKLYSVRQGEKIDQMWRLDAEDVNALRLTYLPLNLPQVLSKSAKPGVAATLPEASTEVNL